jgi:hypothetical protein
MNQRDRFIQALQFESADRLPFMDSGYIRLDPWHTQGLPGTVDTEEQVEKYFGLDRGFALCLLTDHDSLGVSLPAGRHSPHLAALMGETPQEVSFFAPRQLAEAIRLKTPADLEAVAARRRGSDQRRLIEDWSHRLEGLQREEAAVGLYLWGFFTCQLELLGPEALARTYLSNPAMIHRINLHHLQFCRELLELVKARTPIDFAVIGETLTGPARIPFTPNLYKEFMKRYYTELISSIRGNNVEVIALCGTGLAAGLVEPLRQAGINACLPCRIAAGDDPLALREKHPEMALYGGIDHRALIAGRDAINTELRRIRPLVRAGGYIPALDNAVLPETPLANYEYYLAQKWGMFFDDQNPRRF